MPEDSNFGATTPWDDEVGHNLGIMSDTRIRSRLMGRKPKPLFFCSFDPIELGSTLPCCECVLGLELRLRPVYGLLIL